MNFIIHLIYIIINIIIFVIINWITPFQIQAKVILLIAR